MFACVHLISCIFAFPLLNVRMYCMRGASEAEWSRLSLRCGPVMRSIPGSLIRVSITIYIFIFGINITIIS